MTAVNSVGNALTGSTGTGAFVGANTPTLITPVIGAATGTSLVTSGGITASQGRLTAGANTGGYSGDLVLYPTTAAKGYVRFIATDNSVDEGITISNAAYGQATALTIPDPGAASANFLLSGLAINSVPSITFSSTSGIIGTTTNNDAAAGSVGEFVSSEVAGGAGSGLTTATPADVTSISLTAGDWDVWGYAGFQASNTTNIVTLIGSVSSTSATSNANSSINQYGGTGIAISGTQNIQFTVPQQRFSLSGTTTIYLVVNQVFSVSTMTRFGGIYARRRR